MNLRQRHLAGTLALDGFENIGGLDSSFFSRTAGDDRDDRGIAEALGDGGANISLGIGLVCLVILVLSRCQVAGVGVQRLEQADAKRRL